MEITQQSPSIDEIESSKVKSFQLANAVEDIVQRPLELLTRLLEGIDRVALVDYPEYANVGDSLIWLGQVALFERLGKKIVYVDAAWHNDLDALRDVVAKGAAVIITGGGNFGTLWPHHQRFRELLLQQLPGATIIQMPQSVCFDDGPALKQFQDIIATCPNFHFLARDFPSYDFAKANFSCSVDLCPDSAFFLGPIDAAKADVDVLYLHRSDKESIDSATESVADVLDRARTNLAIEETDWLKQNSVERGLQKLTRGLIRLRILRNTNVLMLHLFNVLAKVRARRGIQIIARGKCVITDRLHAHILSVLIGRHNLLLDNSNGKVYAFYEAWTRDWPRSRKVQTLTEALAGARVIVQRGAVALAVGALSLLPVALQRLAGELYVGIIESEELVTAFASGWLV